MDNIDKIILKHFNPLELHKTSIYKFQVRNAMQEYAEQYANRCLEMAAEKSEIEEYWDYDYFDNERKYFRVDKESILTIELPDHE